ncbi:glutamate-5-semialdehyde dehydrogenase [Sporolactobacillus vineae]|uniref:glutamate-5-semialdehyde dehydrogenase n=1 Tax=Sporolactobacillus vineae TaxID=444463 RepID=UPI0002886E5A|nr:glutamate-5-semialdehyde dehydrogenase [Sporolactobacillus vineae]
MNQKIKADDLLSKGRKAKNASQALAAASSDQKNTALLEIAANLRRQSGKILSANAQDVQAAKKAGTTDALIDRLTLTDDRLSSMADALVHLTKLKDPIGNCLTTWTRPNGLRIRKISVPLGVVGMVYEARPNVTTDAAGLCLKTGNAVFLRGSGSALNANKALVSVIQEALTAAHLPADGVQLLEDTRHETADRFFRLNGLIDVLIPRGSKRLIRNVIEKASVPVIETGAGNCHLFIDRSAKPEMAISIALNAKVQRPSVCNAIETIIVERNWFNLHGHDLIDALQVAGVTCRIDPEAADQYPELRAATEDDWKTEYLDKIVAIKIVGSTDEAITHINRYGTEHSESIVSETPEHVAHFFKYVDASTLYHNASTRFTDGEEFGFGAEIGISTQKLHARGPMGLDALTSIKYLVEGDGQIRE